MQRIDTPTAANGGLFSNGDPAIGLPATELNAAWFNAVQEEICNVILSTPGVALQPGVHDQLRYVIDWKVNGALNAANEHAVAAVAVAAATAARAALDEELAGQIAYFARATPPDGWLAASGQEISRAQFGRLFSRIGISHGGGDGSTTFTLPDLRGVFVRGLDLWRGIDPGRALGSYQEDELKSHRHGVRMNSLGGSGEYHPKWDNTAAESPDETYAAGGVETRPKNVALLPCIRF